ncbi:hypothetical protein QF035_004648 [Streptomyces umbrinus]|uniref:Uncharacterized protein n=1 Tax=Streptomyces umbrinus TaxID=67370 RepID=A0ABU0SUB0_9ACTN|nr:hypothetical protein [Streptomyces umbrinus]MDQ1027066.1 hypothetical protein [Streptomyces umbrinus]
MTAVIGVLVGVLATEGAHYWRGRLENPAIRLTVRSGDARGEFTLSNLGYMSGYRVGVSVGWATPRGHFRPSHHIRQWSEIPPGAELRFSVPAVQMDAREAVMVVAWREGRDPTSRRRMQLWPLT